MRGVCSCVPRAGGDRLSFIDFQLPTLVDEPPDGDGWIHEIKYDGYRTQLVIEGGRARAFTRRGFDWSASIRTSSRRPPRCR